MKIDPFGKVIGIVPSALFIVLTMAYYAAPVEAAEWDIPAPLEEAFVTGAQATGLDPWLLAAWASSETEWNPYIPGSPGSTEKGLFHMTDRARLDVGCQEHDPYDRFQDAVCAANYLRLAIRRCGSLTTGLTYVKTGYCYRLRKGSVANRVLGIHREILRWRAFLAAKAAIRRTGTN